MNIIDEAGDKDKAVRLESSSLTVAGDTVSAEVGYDKDNTVVYMKTSEE